MPILLVNTHLIVLFGSIKFYNKMQMAGLASSLWRSSGDSTVHQCTGRKENRQLWDPFAHCHKRRYSCSQLDPCPCRSRVPSSWSPLCRSWSSRDRAWWSSSPKQYQYHKGDGSLRKPALRQDIDYMVEKTYHDIAPYMVEKTYNLARYLGSFGAYLMPQGPNRVQNRFPYSKMIVGRWRSNQGIFNLVKKP